MEENTKAEKILFEVEQVCVKIRQLRDVIFAEDENLYPNLSKNNAQIITLNTCEEWLEELLDKYTD